LTAIAVHLSPKDVAHLKEVFKNIDHNGDGCLNLDELREGIADIRNNEDLIELLRAADTDKNGTINYTGKYPKFGEISFYFREPPFSKIKSNASKI
jgi:Ca2+-binding EF-hand superfamily protein